MKSKANTFSGLYFMSYASLGSLSPLIGQYLYSIGFTGGEIGVVTASATAVGIVSNPIWGAVYHKRGKNIKLVAILYFLAAFIALSLIGINRYVLFLAVYTLVFFFVNPVFPLVDSITIESDYPFGRARKWGAVGYAAGIGLAGYMAGAFGLICVVPIFSILLSSAGLIMTAFAKHRKATVDAVDFSSGIEYSGGIAKRKDGFADLLRNRRYAALLAGAFFINGPSFAHNTYFSFLYKDQGGTLAGMGLVFLLMTASEAPFMAWSAKLTSRFTIERMILTAMCVSSLRFLWYSTGPATSWIMGTFFLQGFVNGIFLVESLNYITKLVGVSTISLGIPLFTALSSNFGTIVCQLSGGIIVEQYGGCGVYLLYGMFNCVGILLYLFFGLHKKCS